MAKALELVSQNYKETQYTAGGTVVAGSFVTQNDLYGFTLVDAVSGDLSTIVYKADKVKAAKTADAVLVAGKKAYYHADTGYVDQTAGTGILVGHVIRAAAAADTYCYIEFDGAINS